MTRDHALPGTGTHVVTFAQTFAGRPAVRGGRLTVSVTPDGRVLTYAGNPFGGGALSGSCPLSTSEALLKVAGVPAPGSGLEPQQAGTRAGYSVFARSTLAAPSYVGAVAFPTRDGARAAYRVRFVKALDEAWDVVIEAASGAVLYRESLVDHESDGTVYENSPGAPRGGTPVRKSFGLTPESPKGWLDPTGVVGSGVTTLGNNASTSANYSNFIGPVDQGPRPFSPTGSFNDGYIKPVGRDQGSSASGSTSEQTCR